MAKAEKREKRLFQNLSYRNPEKRQEAMQEVKRMTPEERLTFMMDFLEFIDNARLAQTNFAVGFAVLAGIGLFVAVAQLWQALLPVAGVIALALLSRLIQWPPVLSLPQARGSLEALLETPPDTRLLPVLLANALVVRAGEGVQYNYSKLRCAMIARLLPHLQVGEVQGWPWEIRQHLRECLQFPLYNADLTVAIIQAAPVIDDPDLWSIVLPLRKISTGKAILTAPIERLGSALEDYHRIEQAAQACAPAKILLRASEAPADSTTLLRAVQTSEETPADQLLRPG